jgi:hypothetical protein
MEVLDDVMVHYTWMFFVMTWSNGGWKFLVMPCCQMDYYLCTDVKHQHVKCKASVVLSKGRSETMFVYHGSRVAQWES